MNTNKRIALGALAVGLLLALAAVPSVHAADPAGGTAAAGTAQTQQSGTWAHMWQMRNIMHYATFAAQTAPKGVTVSVTSADPALVTAIQQEFTADKGTLTSPLAGSTVVVTQAPDGITLAFSSEDGSVVQALQSYGASLGYTLLRNNMHAAMVSLYGEGWGPGTGYGPGMMGPGWGRGYGPGMMGPGWRGGYGHGWMHGYGPGGGYGPQAPQTPPY